MYFEAIIEFVVGESMQAKVDLNLWEGVKHTCTCTLLYTAQTITGSSYTLTSVIYLHTLRNWPPNFVIII